jgi:hypothetical protein
MNNDFYRMTHNYHTNDKEKIIDVQRLRRMNPNYLTFYQSRIRPEDSKVQLISEEYSKQEKDVMTELETTIAKAKNERVSP